MRSAGVILLLCLLGAFFAAGKAPAATADDAAVICYRGGEGFMLDVPPGWGNLRQTADELGLCAMLSPGITDFHGAPALIYPRLAERVSEAADSAAIEAFMANSLKRFIAAPGGENSRLSRGKAVMSDSGLAFELYYLDDGPDNNEFEVIACHAGKNSILLAVLTTYSPESRLSHMPDFMAILKSVRAFKVAGAN